MILDYNHHIEKREVQKKLIPLVKKRKLVCLAGPNINAYLDMFPAHMKQVEIWEHNRSVMMHQMRELEEVRARIITYNFGDIFNAQVDKTAFYDFDFCRTIRGLQHYVEKFKSCAFQATFSNRDCSLERTIELFLEAVREKMLLDVYHPQFNLLKTNKNSYLYTTHVDSSPMMTIFKFH